MAWKTAIRINQFKFLYEIGDGICGRKELLTRKTANLLVKEQLFSPPWDGKRLFTQL